MGGHHCCTGPHVIRQGLWLMGASWLHRSAGNRAGLRAQEGITAAQVRMSYRTHHCCTGPQGIGQGLGLRGDTTAAQVRERVRA